MVYIETSALAKCYLAEAESALVEEITQRAAPAVYTSRITYPEVLSLLARSVRDRRISNDDYQRHKRCFLRDWELLKIVEPTAECLRPAERLVERYPLRGFDAVHLCSALLLGTPDFACFDSRLQAAARAEGLAVIP
jgi:predicted nucleic acid-binding protein